MTLRVLHLVGSVVSEFYADLSRLYAADCLAATADPERYEFLIAYVAPGGGWSFPASLRPEDLAAAPAMTVPAALAHLAALDVDAMVPQMFCIPGMTYYRGLFDLLAIPYVGNPPAVMAVAADKAVARAVVAATGVRVPEGEVLRRGDLCTLTPPVVVKPVDTDNSLGVALVREPAQLAGALEQAFGHAHAVLVERYIELGREVRCGLLERDGKLVGLPLEEYRMDSATKPIRDAADKITRVDGGNLTLMAKDTTRAWSVDVSDPLTQRVWDVARVCHTALGCRDYSLFDFRVDPAGEVWFLEAGLYCSFARQSVIPMMAGHAGIAIEDLFLTAITTASTR